MKERVAKIIFVIIAIIALAGMCTMRDSESERYDGVGNYH